MKLPLPTRKFRVSNRTYNLIRHGTTVFYRDHGASTSPFVTIPHNTVREAKSFMNRPDIK